MANNTLMTRILLCNATTVEWSTSSKVLLKGEVALEFPETGVPKIKIGDGVNTFADLQYAVMTPAEVTAKINEIVADSEYDDTAINDLITALDGRVTVNEEAIAAINNATTGILAQAKAYTDAEVKELADGAVKTNTDAIAVLNGDETTAGSVAKAVKDASDAINATIGTVADGKTVVGMIEDVVANGYDDEEVRELISDNADAITTLDGEVGDLTTLKTTEKGSLVGAVNEVVDAVEAHKEAIDETVETLVGDDTGKSVRTIANEELAKQLVAEGAAESLDTLEEIAAWIQSHPEDASAMNKAIEDLEALVGTLPEGVTATTVVGYIAEAVAAEKTRAEEVESDLDERLQAVETAVGTDGNVADLIATAKTEAISESKEYTDDEIDKVEETITNLDTAVIKGVKVQGTELTKDADGKVDITSITTDALVNGTNILVLNGGGAN